VSTDPKPDYEAPSVEEIETEDAPAVTAAGTDSLNPPSDLRLKHSLRALEPKLHEEAQREYEAPSVDEIETEDAPAVTAAGDDSPIIVSDLRLKHSLRPLEAKLGEEPERVYEAPSVEEVETEDAPSVTAAGADSPGDFSDLRLKHSLRLLEDALTQLR